MSNLNYDQLEKAKYKKEAFDNFKKGLCRICVRSNSKNLNIYLLKYKDQNFLEAMSLCGKHKNALDLTILENLKFIKTKNYFLEEIIELNEQELFTLKILC